MSNYQRDLSGVAMLLFDGVRVASGIARRLKSGKRRKKPFLSHTGSISGESRAAAIRLYTE
jgi:hypothetical protein